ncbi:MAG: hypothetical protein AB1607_02885 [Chloroflexota bacterium]
MFLGDSAIGRVIDFAKRRLVLLMPRRPRPYPELARLRELFDSKGSSPQVLLLGDSVAERVSRFDKDRRSLGNLLAAEFKSTYRFVCISHSAYHLKIFEAFLETLRLMKHKPKLVILPVNMRSFSPQWDLEPSWQFDREIEALKEYASNSQRAIPALREMAVLPDQYERFDATEVQYPSTSFNRVGQFRLVINAKPQSKEQFNYRKKQIFIFHYLHKLSTTHTKLKSLIRIAKKMKSMNIGLLVYITPVNYQGGNRYVGNIFSSLLKKNVHVVRQILNPYLSREIRLIDLSQYLTSDQFFNIDEPTEHLNQHGRAKLASRIFNSAMEMMALKGSIVS